MRLWSLSPALLDRRALVAGWREALLAQKVLRGMTTGYTHHPQLERFRSQTDPVMAICAYLHGLADEADRRGYSFDRARIARSAVGQEQPLIPVTRGQIAYELAWLRTKTAQRDPGWDRAVLAGIQGEPPAHPLLFVVDGPVEPWERL